MARRLQRRADAPKRAPRRSGLRRAACWANGLLTVALLTASVALAREKIVLVPFASAQGASPEDAERFTRLMESQLGLENLLWTPAPIIQRAGSSLVPAALTEARKQYAARRFSQARATLEHALSAQQRAPDAFEAAPTAAAYVLLGAIELRGGSERNAREALQQAMRLDPSYRPPRGQYPPIFLRELDRARRDVARLPHFWITVEGPAGADVLFDGKRIGILPNVRVHAAKGAHHLQLKGVNGEEIAEWIDVTATTSIPIFFPPAPESGPLPRLEGKSLTEAYAGTLAHALAARDAKLAAVGVMSRGPDGQLEAHAALFIRDGRTFVTVEPVRFDPTFRAAEGEALVLTERLAEAREGNKPPVALPFDLAPVPIAVAEAPRVDTKAAPRSAPVAPKLTPEQVPQTRSALTGPPVTTSEEESGSFLSRVPTWVWITGVVALAAGAGATVYAVSRNSKRVSGTVEASW